MHEFLYELCETSLGGCITFLLLTFLFLVAVLEQGSVFII